MQKDIKSDCLTIKELLKQHTSIKISYFQCQYVWNFKSEIKTLITDLCDDMEQNNKSYYFLLGTIIVKHDSKFTLIIDGQQRITTILLLIFALYKNQSLDLENKKLLMNC